MNESINQHIFIVTKNSLERFVLAQRWIHVKINAGKTMKRNLNIECRR